MSIPREFIRDLIDRADIAEVVGAHVQLKRRGGNLFGLCPFHHEKTPSFSVNPAKRIYHCFGCGVHGDALGFITQMNGGDFVAAVEQLAAVVGVPVPRVESEDKQGPDIGGVLREAMMHWRQCLKKTPPAIDYLKKRGVTGETAKRYGIGYAADAWDDLINALAKNKELLLAAGLVREKDGRIYDYFRRRIMFPISESGGRLCGFGGRVLDDKDEPKYLNSAENARFTKGRILYGMPQAMDAARKRKRLLVCEGYMDVVMLSQAGFGEAVATMGTAATAAQMKKAARLAPNIVFAFDSDAAGRKAALRALEGVLPALKDGVGVSFLFLPEGEDPDSYIRKHGAPAFEERIGAAKSLGGFMADALWENAPVADDDGRRAALMKEGERLLRLIKQDDAPYWRQLLAEDLARRAGMEAEPLQRAVKKPMAVGRQSVYKMNPADKLYVLLCCLTVAPDLINKVEPRQDDDAEQRQGSVPLLGSEADVAIVAEVLSKLRWNMDEDPPTVPDLLEENGYTALARQMRESVPRRLSSALDVSAEFDALVERLWIAHHRVAATGKNAWLKKLSAD